MSGTTYRHLILAASLLLLPLPAPFAQVSSEAPAGIVDCLLPGALRRVGGALYQMPQRPARTSASECTIRGGDFLLYDRANYETSLKHWTTQAEQGSGDPDAMLYVAEIYEQGIGRDPDYVAAAGWYQKAADLGNTTAMINLAHLYKTGQGVDLDLQVAQNLYSQAFGSDIPVLLDPTAVKGADQRVATLVAEVDEVRRQKIAVELELQAANAQLASARRNLDDALAGDGENAAMIRELQASIEKQRQEIASYQANVDSMQAENEELKSLRQQLEDKEIEAARLESLLADANSAVNSSKDQLTRQQETLQEQQAQFNELLTDVNADRDSLRTSSVELEAQRQNIRNMEAALRKAEEERDLYQVLASDAATQEERVATLTARIAVLEQQSGNASAETDTLRDALAEARSRLDAQVAAASASRQSSAAEIAAREEEIERMRAAVVRAEQETNRHSSDIDRLSQQSVALEQLRADLEREQAQSNRLKQLLTESQDRFAISTVRTQELTTARQALETEIEVLRANASQDDQQSQATLIAKEQELQAQQAELDTLQAQIAESETEFERYQQQMTDTASRQRQAIEDLRVAVAASHAEREQLEGKLASANQQLSSARTDLELEQQRYTALQDDLREARAQTNAGGEALDAMQSMLDEQNRKVAVLEQERARLNEQTNRYLAEINDLKERSQAEKVEFVGPTLELLEPRDNLLSRTGLADVGEEGLPEVTVISANHVGETKIIRGRVNAPAGLASITIGGLEVAFDENYAFAQSLKLDAESKHIRIVAQDHSGKEDVREFRYEVEGGERSVAVVRNKKQRFEDTRNDALDHLRYYALIIANEEYENPAMADLDTPVADAEAIGEILTNRYNFDVEILRDATKSEIHAAIENIFYVAERDDVSDNDRDAVLIYYARAWHGQ